MPAIHLDWIEHAQFRVSLPDPHAIRHGDVVPLLHELRAIRPDAMELRTLGQSAEGRDVYMASVGVGRRQVLAWSQMHGDEPTHTTVLLDLLSFLQHAPDHPVAAGILAESTFRAIVMLNPDGAERGTRRNAQGIDVNRDALALASPEARILHAAVEEFQPDFALNLHNHNPRRTVGDTHNVAAVALLAPPSDEQATETPNVLLAKQVASCFRRAVEPHAPGMTARYRADFMPTAFGEWVQRQGAATVLVEAGGWPTLDATPLRQLHFFGLASMLYDVATDAYATLDKHDYDSLPLTGEIDLFDLKIQGATIVDDQLPPLVADIGVNRSSGKLQSDEALRGGVIDEIGDLHQTTGKTMIEAAGLTCVPGGIVYDPHVTPLQLPGPAAVRQCLSSGVTTLIGVCDDGNAIEMLPPQSPLPINVGFIGSAEQRTRERRPRIDIGAVADLALWRTTEVVHDNRQAAQLDPRDLHQVLVGGTVVFDRGNVIDAPVGRWLALE